MSIFVTCPNHPTIYLGDRPCQICRSESFDRVFNPEAPFDKPAMTMDAPRIPDFMNSLDKMRELHLRKNEDYAQDSNPFSNFDFTEFILSHFKSDLDKSFVWPIATKLARLANLLESKTPNNESIEDSFLDIAVYVLLWKARRTSVSTKLAETSSRK